MAKTNLSLGALYGAWSGTARAGAVSSSLNAANNLAGTAVSMSSFAFDSLAITQPFTYIVENTAENVVVAFTTQGLAFDNRVKNVAANYTITISDSTYFSIGTKSSTTAITAKNLGTTPYSGSNSTTLSVTYADGYNVNATNYNTTSTKTIYSVDSYNGINSDALCVATDTDILMADGSTIKAADLYVGDVIKTFVPTGMPNWLPENDQSEWYWWYSETGSNGEIVDANVSNVYFSFIDEYVSVNYGQIKTTMAHPFFAWDNITETYQFTRASDLTEGDKIVKYNAETGLVEDVLVEKIEYINKTLEIATITVDVAHTYLSNGFVSHNKGSATAPIPWTNLVCYCDVNFTASYVNNGDTNFNDLAGYSTGWNLTGGTLNPAITAPTLNAGPPKSLQFASGKYGIKEQAYSSGTGNANFNTTTAGYTIIALVNGSAGNILSRGTDYTFAASGTTMSLTSTPNGNATSTTTTLTGWHMLAVTAGNGTTTFYNNGTQVSTSTTTSAATTGTADIYLMQNNTGALGGFLFYQRALSSTEILNIYNNFHTRTSYV
jgi:hypothetical protein